MIFVYMLICLIFAGFFAGLEVGLLSANRMLIQEKKRQGILYARAVEFLLSKPERFFGTTLIGYNIGNVTAAVLLTNYFEAMGLASYIWLAILAMTFVFLIFDDIIPKSFLRQHANSIAVKLGPVLLFFYWIFLPISIVLNAIVKMLLIVLGKNKSQREELRNKRDLRFLVKLSGKEAGLPVADQEIIEDILHFRDQIAREAMVPFHLLPVLNLNQEIEDAVRLSIETHHRFIPVAQHRTDNMVGYVDTTELLWSEKQYVRDIMKKAVFYPETRRIPDLLLEMNKGKLKVVFLVDEYGAIAGMITPNQIVADVVHYTPENGSIEEEIRQIDRNHFIAAAETDLEDLCHTLGITLPRSENKTIGGYISERLGIVPEVDAKYTEAGFVFKVLKCDDRHIQRLEIFRSGTENDVLKQAPVNPDDAADA